MRPVIVGPNVFSWSEPIQMRNLVGNEELEIDRRRPIFQKVLPIWTLDASGQCRPDTGSSADSNASLKHGGSVPDAGYSVC